MAFVGGHLEELRKALREIANRAGSPTMHYFPEMERQEQRASLDWIAVRALQALLGEENGQTESKRSTDPEPAELL